MGKEDDCVENIAYFSNWDYFGAPVNSLLYPFNNIYEKQAGGARLSIVTIKRASHEFLPRMTGRRRCPLWPDALPRQVAIGTKEVKNAYFHGLFKNLHKQTH